jgi:hypothetical protein
MTETLLIGGAIALAGLGGLVLVVSSLRLMRSPLASEASAQRVLTRVICPGTTGPTVVWLGVVNRAPEPHIEVVQCERFGPGAPRCHRTCVAAVA